MRYTLKIHLVGGGDPFTEGNRSISIPCESDVELKRLSAFVSSEVLSVERGERIQNHTIETAWGAVLQQRGSDLISVQGKHGMVSLRAGDVTMIEPIANREVSDYDHHQPQGEGTGFYQTGHISQFRAGPESHYGLDSPFWEPQEDEADSEQTREDDPRLSGLRSLWRRIRK